jgi:RNA ligase
MKYNLEVLSDYINRGLVIKQNHPTLPLSIYNYSRECQYNKEWDAITLNCRGLVLDTEGNVIAKPFPKFFNYEEHTADKIPNESFEVYEKMDGSLGIIFHYEGEWLIATRGSFTSEQAIKGMEILNKYNLVQLMENYTYLVEIIYPENRIVVDYGKEERLVLLGIVRTDSGEELDYITMCNESDVTGIPLVMMYKTWGEDWETLKKEISKDNEGYVIRFSGGMRMKIKGDEYVRLHRILTNFSTKDIWELLRNNEQLEPFLDRVPDEFDAWVKEVVRDLQTEFDTTKNKIEIEFRELIDKKEFADKIADNPNRSLLFKRLDSYSPQFDEMIWKLVKPKYEKPFKKDENN